jgi:hypothetical protein
MKPVKPEWHNEDQVETKFRRWLENHGWHVQLRPGLTGSDICATDSRGISWVFEVKGYPGTFQKRDGASKSRNIIVSQRRTWLIEGLGQIVSRMTKENIQYALVFPDHPTDKYFETKTLGMPQFLRSKLSLWIYLVGSEMRVRILAPESDQFTEWSNDPA